MQNNLRRSFRSLFGAFLLVIYSVGAISIDLFHYSIHDHQNAEVHSAIAEKDPCHRTIYHGDEREGCDHKAHVTTTEGCKLSHVVFQAQQLLTEYISQKPVYEKVFVLFDHAFSLLKTNLQQPLLRGPPYLA